MVEAPLPGMQAWLKEFEVGNDHEAVKRLSEAADAIGEAQTAVDEARDAADASVRTLETARKMHKEGTQLYQQLPLTVREKNYVTREERWVDDLEAKLLKHLPDMTNHRIVYLSYMHTVADRTWRGCEQEHQHDVMRLFRHYVPEPGSERRVEKGFAGTITMYATGLLELIGFYVLHRLLKLMVDTEWLNFDATFLEKLDRGFGANEKNPCVEEGALDGDDVVRMVEESGLFGPETMDSARKNVRTILGSFEESWSDVENDEEREDPDDYYDAFKSWSDKMDDDNKLAHDCVMLWHYLRTASHNIDYSAVVALTAFVEDILANIIEDAYKQTQQEVALNKKTDWYKALLYTDNQSHTEHPYVLAHGVKTSKWAHEMRKPAWPENFGGDNDKWGDVRGVDIEDFIGVETCVTRRHIWNAIAQQSELKAFFTGDVFDAETDDGAKEDDAAEKEATGGKKQKTA
jgi:hypothetical protein